MAVRLCVPRRPHYFAPHCTRASSPPRKFASSSSPPSFVQKIARAALLGTRTLLAHRAAASRLAVVPSSTPHRTDSRAPASATQPSKGPRRARGPAVRLRSTSDLRDFPLHVGSSYPRSVHVYRCTHWVVLIGFTVTSHTGNLRSVLLVYGYTVVLLVARIVILYWYSTIPDILILSRTRTLTQGGRHLCGWESAVSAGRNLRSYRVR